MPISGYVGAGAQEALAEVLQRRLQEHQRRQEEQRQAQDLQIRREQIALQKRAAEETTAERAENRRYRMEDRASKLAEGIVEDVGYGDISEEQGALVEKDPRYAGRVKRFDRPIIDARPIQGTTPLDASGPQSRKVVRLEPTGAQAKQQQIDDERRRILMRLPGADPTTRRNLQSEAAAAGVQGLDSSLFGQSEEEKARDAEQRFLRQNAVQFGQQKELQGQSEAAAAARARASDAAAAQRARENDEAAERRAQAAADRAKPDPESQAKARDDALTLARELKSHPGLKDMTGFRGSAYGYGYRDEPFSGSQAATAKKLLDSLQALLTIPNLTYLKGPMSDKDIAFIKAASTALDSQLRDVDFIKKLDDVITRLENPTGEGWRDKPGRNPAGDQRPLAPGTSVTIGNDGGAVEVELNPKTGRYEPKKKSGE